jgi:putative endopeptidase
MLHYLYILFIIYIYNIMTKTRKAGIIKKSKSFSHISSKQILSRKKREGCRETYSRFEKKYSQSEKYLSKKMKLEKELISVFKKRAKGAVIRPQDDFYGYINNEWVLKASSTTEEQKYIVQVDTYRLVQYKVLTELNGIIEDYIKNNNNALAHRMKCFKSSVVHNLTDRAFEHHITSYINVLDENRANTDNLWKWLGFVNKSEIVSIGCPLRMSLQPDEKQSKVFRMYVNAAQLSLIDLSIYDDEVEESNYKKRVKRKYFQFLTDVSNVMEKINPSYIIVPEDVFAVEQEILQAMYAVDPSIVEPKDFYNKITHKKAMTKLGGFDWNAFSVETGFKKPPDFFLCYSLTYLKKITENLKSNWNSEKWRSYWIYIFAKQIIRCHKETMMLSFKFFGEYLKGMEKPMGENLGSVVMMSIAFNKFMSERYIDQYAIPEHLEYTRGFTEDLVEVYKRIVSRNTWLSPKTKKYALKKLEHLNLIIGTAPEILEDPVLDYSETDYWENLSKVMAWRVETKISLEGHKVIDIPEIDYSEMPPKFVGKQSYIVNAMYTPSENSIYIPLAYLQKPFIDLDERGIEYNLAHLGFTLCHEMSHSLDDMGSQYDHTGNLRNWWTPHDSEVFKKKQQNIIQQYEYLASLDGIKFDAGPSVGEDLADISGLAICQEYLRDFQDKNDDIAPIRKLSYLAFFVYFAYQQRQKISKKAINAQLHTNPHPLDKYRTNAPLARLELFRAVWNITKKDKMYWPSMDTIW